MVSVSVNYIPEPQTFFNMKKQRKPRNHYP